MNQELKNIAKRGVTLIEILVVIAMLSILYGTALVSIDAPKQYKKARDVQRANDVAILANALSQCYHDNRESFGIGTFNPCYQGAAISSTPQEIGDNSQAPSNATNTLVDLCPLVDLGYINKIPLEPDPTKSYFQADSPKQPGCNIFYVKVVDDSFCPYGGNISEDYVNPDGSVYTTDICPAWDMWTHEYRSGYKVSIKGNRITVSADSEVNPGSTISFTR